MGANHPYPNAPKAARRWRCARRLGFDVLPALVFALTPGDYSSAQRLSPQGSGAHYAYLGNTVGLQHLRAEWRARSAGVAVQFLEQHCSGASTRTPRQDRRRCRRRRDLFLVPADGAWPGAATRPA